MLNPTDVETTGTVVRFPDRSSMAVVTPRGHAMVALYRFERVFATLDAEDREYVLDALAALILEARNGR